MSATRWFFVCIKTCIHTKNQKLAGWLGRARVALKLHCLTNAKQNDRTCLIHWRENPGVPILCQGRRRVWKSGGEGIEMWWAYLPPTPHPDWDRVNRSDKIEGGGGYDGSAMVFRESYLDCHIAHPPFHCVKNKSALRLDSWSVLALQSVCTIKHPSTGCL